MVDESLEQRPHSTNGALLYKSNITLSKEATERLLAAASAIHKGSRGRGNERPSHVLLYLPDNLDLYDLLHNSSNDHWLHSSRIIKLQFVISCIYWFPLVSKSNESNSYDYIQLKFSYLARMIGTRYARPALDLLLKLGIIESDHSYIVGQKSIGYRLSAQFRGRAQAVEVYAPSFSAKLAANSQNKKNQSATVTHHIHHHPVYDWINESIGRLTYPDEVDSYLASFSGEKYDYRKICIESIRQRSSFFSIDAKTGRCYNIVTSTPGELRSRLLLDGEPVVEIDIASAQPLLAATLYPENCPEKERYLAAIDSDFYLTLNSQAGGPYSDRDMVKKACYKEIFFGPVIPNAPLWNAFQQAFPWLARHIAEIKHTAPRSKRRYRVKDGKKVLRRGSPAFALLLQSKEAEIVIKCTGESLRQRSIPFVSIHDSILCRRRDAALVGAMLAEMICDKTSLSAKLTAKAA